MISAILLALLIGAVPARGATEADSQFTFAVRLMQQGEIKLADEALTEFTRKFSDDRRVADAHYYQALLARQRGDLRAAATHLDQVNNAQYVSPEAVTMLKGQVKLESGNPAAAVAEFEKIDASKLKDVETRATWAYLLGAAYQAADNPTAAAKQFDMASEADSSVRGLALLELGKTRIKLNAPAAAIEALTAAAKSDDLDADAAAEARALSADLAYDLKQYEMAADLYKQIVQQHQASGYFKPALIGLLRALYAAGQDAELIKQYQATRQLLSPDAQGEAIYLVAASHVRMEQYKQGMESLIEYFKRQGKDHEYADEAAYLYAVCFYHTDLTGFERWIAGVEAQIPAMAHAHQIQYLRAQAAAKLDKPEDAIRYLGVVIDDPENPYARRAMLQRAALYEQLGRVDKASDDYALYAQRYGTDPRSADAGRRAIDLAFSAGKFEQVAEQAQAWLMQKDVSAAESAPVRLRLAVSLIKLKRNAGAMAVLDQLLAGEADKAIKSLAHFYRGLLLAANATPPAPGQDDSTRPALEALDQALKGDLPADQRLEGTRIAARLHRMAGRDKQAIDLYEDLRKRQSVDPFDTPTALWVARGLADRGQYESALAWALGMVERKDEKPEALAEAMYLAADSYRQLGKHKEAGEMFRRLIAYSHGFSEQARLGLAQSLAATDQADQALEEYDGLINANTSQVAATALFESALLRRAQADRLEAAGDKSGAEVQRDEARKRLHRVTILYDMPQLGDLPIRSYLALGRLEAAADHRDKARAAFDKVAERQGEAAWNSAGKAEIQLLDGKRGDALFLLRKILKDAADSPAAAYARDRLIQLGETP
ncbi:tetratricopeptide repeat protein [Planctomycetales bacterium ZRK34]|nr:tetratricopeptide repeat protein [Planctomycetales bacterium ZRK34]